MRHRFVAPRADRLDLLLREQTPLSRSAARALVTAGAVLVDGRCTRHPAHAVAEGAVVEARTHEDEGAVALVERYRDDDVLVVDKPSGLPTQSARSGGAHLYGLLDAQEPYVGLHHRLDTPASGLVLLTLSRDVNKVVADAFRTHRIQRGYRVVVLGDPGEAGTWDGPLDGKPAETRWRRLGAAGGLSALSVELVTGRTHQIRRHAVEAGHPVLGDRRHGGAAGRLWPRLALHAATLRFDHPRTRQPVAVEAPLPDDLAALFAKAGA